MIDDTEHREKQSFGEHCSLSSDDVIDLWIYLRTARLGGTGSSHCAPLAWIRFCSRRMSRVSCSSHCRRRPHQPTALVPRGVLQDFRSSGSHWPSWLHHLFCQGRTGLVKTLATRQTAEIFSKQIETGRSKTEFSGVVMPNSFGNLLMQKVIGMSRPLVRTSQISTRLHHADQMK